MLVYIITNMYGETIEEVDTLEDAKSILLWYDPDGTEGYQIEVVNTNEEGV